jgi:hypothetical protein
MTTTILNETESHCGSLTLEKCRTTRKIKIKGKASSLRSLGVYSSEHKNR